MRKFAAIRIKTGLLGVSEDDAKSLMAHAEATLNAQLKASDCPVNVRLERMDAGHAIGIALEWNAE